MGAEPKQQKKLNMGLIILISIAVSALITFGYFGIEGFLVHSGKNMPFQREVYGGECIDEIGIFWGRTILCPMSSVDEPAVSEPDIIGFNRIKLLKVFAGMAFALWIILCFINKRFKVPIITVAVLATGAFLFLGGKKIKEAVDETPVELSSIKVFTSDIHEDTYCGLWYPHSALHLVKAGEDGKYGKTDSVRMENYTLPAEVSKAQLKALIKATEALKENTDTDRGKDFAYNIYVVYKQLDGYGSIRVKGYGAFPEEWADFARIVNEICGKDYLSEDPVLVSFSYDWFSEKYGIYDKDLPIGMTLEDFLEGRDITMNNICGQDDSGELFTFDPGKILEEPSLMKR